MWPTGWYSSPNGQLIQQGKKNTWEQSFDDLAQDYELLWWTVLLGRFLFVCGWGFCFSFFIAYEKNNSKNSNPNPTPFSIIQKKTCLGIRSCTWQSAFHIWCLLCCLLHPSATQPIIYWCCSLLRSTEQSVRIGQGENGKICQLNILGCQLFVKCPDRVATGETGTQYLKSSVIF